MSYIILYYFILQTELQGDIPIPDYIIFRCYFHFVFAPYIAKSRDAQKITDYIFPFPVITPITAPIPNWAAMRTRHAV